MLRQRPRLPPQSRVVLVREAKVIKCQTMTIHMLFRVARRQMSSVSHPLRRRNRGHQGSTIIRAGTSGHQGSTTISTTHRWPVWATYGLKFVQCQLRAWVHNSSATNGFSINRGHSTVNACETQMPAVIFFCCTHALQSACVKRRCRHLFCCYL